MTTGPEFDSLYHQLARAWEAHQQLCLSHAPFSRLAESSSHLQQTRLAMWDWHQANRVRTG